MVEFLYTLHTNVTIDSAMPLLRLSCLYEIVALQYVRFITVKAYVLIFLYRAKCIDFLQNNVNVHNCIELIHISSMHQDISDDPTWKRLFTTCWEFLQANFATLDFATNISFSTYNISLVVNISTINDQVHVR